MKKTPTDTVQGYLDATIRRITLAFGLDDYVSFVKRIGLVRKAHGLADNTAAVEFLLNYYEGSVGRESA